MNAAHDATLWAEFESASQALAAARELRARGYAQLEAFTPYPLPELEQVLGLKRPRLLLALVLAAAIVGGSAAFLIMWWTAARSYPLDVGGRPLNSFVTDIPIMFESAVLSAAVTAFLGTLFFSGLPRLHHPLDALPGFERTSIDRFWLGVAEDPSRADDHLPELLQELSAVRVQRAPAAEAP